MNAKPQKMVYNTDRYRVKEYDWDVFAGPSAGEKFVDVALGE